MKTEFSSTETRKVSIGQGCHHYSTFVTKFKNILDGQRMDKGWTDRWTRAYLNIPTPLS